MTPLTFKALVHLTSTEHGGRKTPIGREYRPDWNLGNSWFGTPELNGARVFLEDREQLAPGEEGLARLDPLSPESWAGVTPGRPLAMHEGQRVVGTAVILEVLSRPPSFSSKVGRFVRAAWQYCEFVTTAAKHPLHERLRLARDRLVELYTAALELPEVISPDDDVVAPAPELPKEFPGFEHFDFYWEVFDPYDHADTAPVVGSLSDDVLDVYRDVQRGLSKWSPYVPSEGAIWAWRFSFDTHWGDHGSSPDLCVIGWGSPSMFHAAFVLGEDSKDISR